MPPRTPGVAVTNIEAVVDPTVNDDESKALEVGSLWINTANGRSFTLIDPTTGAAVWRNLPFGPAGGDLADTYPGPTVAQASKSFALNGVISPASLGANQDNWSPTGLSTATMLRVTSSVDVTITGLSGGAAGRLLTIYNVGSFKVSFLKESVSSTAANRFAVDNDVLLKPNTAVVIQYDATSSRWRVAGAGSAVPTLLPVPKFFVVTVDTTTTQQPPGWATLLSGSFTLASSDTNLIVLLAANFAASNASRKIEVRVLINGTPIGGSGGSTSAAGIPFAASFLAQIVGVTGPNTFAVQWRINSGTAYCRPVAFPDRENAAISIWSSAAL